MYNDLSYRVKQNKLAWSLQNVTGGKRAHRGRAATRGVPLRCDRVAQGVEGGLVLPRFRIHRAERGETPGKRGGRMFDPCGVEYLADFDGVLAQGSTISHNLALALQTVQVYTATRSLSEIRL